MGCGVGVAIAVGDVATADADGEPTSFCAAGWVLEHATTMRETALTSVMVRTRKFVRTPVVTITPPIRAYAESGPPCRVHHAPAVNDAFSGQYDDSDVGLSRGHLVRRDDDRLTEGP